MRDGAVVRIAVSDLRDDHGVVALRAGSVATGAAGQCQRHDVGGGGGCRGAGGCGFRLDRHQRTENLNGSFQSNPPHCTGGDCGGMGDPDGVPVVVTW